MTVRIWPDEAQARDHASHTTGYTARQLTDHTWITCPIATSANKLAWLADGLTGPASPARTTDPVTAHQAANAHDRTTDRDRALTILRANPNGLTDDALAELMGRRPTSAGKRRLELVEIGLVEATPERRPTRTGSPAIVWRAIAS